MYVLPQKKRRCETRERKVNDTKTQVLPGKWRFLNRAWLGINSCSEIGKDPDAGKDWRQEDKGTTEMLLSIQDVDTIQDDWMVLPIQ